MAGERRNVVAYFSTQGWNDVRADLNSLGEKGQQVFDRIAKSARGVDAPLRGVNQVSRELRGSMENMASRAGAVGNVLASIGPKGLAAAAAIGAVGVAVTKGLQAFAAEERGLLRLDAVLRATGNTAGLTRDQMSDLAEELERRTFFPKEEILQAQAALTTFKAVSGDAFENTIRLAVDLSEVMGGDVVSNARLLGKALQDPAEGFDMLKRKIGELNPEIAANAEALANSGRKAEAVDLIIGELQAKMGGAATEAASGYAGKIDNLKDSFDDLFKSVGALAASTGLPDWLAAVARQIDSLTEKLTRVRDFTHSDAVNDNLEQARRDLGIAESLGHTEIAQNKRDEIAYYQKRLNEIRNRENAKDYGTEFGPQTKEQIAAKKEADRLEKERVKSEQARLRTIKQSTAAIKEGTAAQKEQVQVASEAQKEYERIWEHTSERIQDVFADSFSEIFDKGLDSFSDLGKKIKSIMLKTAGEIAAAMVFRPVVSSVFGGFMPSLGGAVAGGAGATAASGLSGYMSGGSSLISGLMNGFSTPLVNPGIAFDIGNMFGLGAGTVGSLHSYLGNFTAGAGLAGFGGNLLGNLLLGNRGVGSSIGGTIGGLAGTAFGPVGAFAGSLLGNVVGGMFGNKKPSSKLQYGVVDLSSGALLESGGLSGKKYSEGNRIAADAVLSAANAISQMLFESTGKRMSGSMRAGVSDRYGYTLDFFDASGGRTALDKNFGNADDAISYIASTMAQSIGTTLPEYLRDALDRIDFSDVQKGLAQLTATLGYRQSLLDLSKSLLTNQQTTNLSPEAYYNLIRDQSQAIFARGDKGEASFEEIAAATSAFLSASEGYAGKGSAFYAGDLSSTQARLEAMAKVAPRFASGGDFGGGMRLVGERGAELEFTGPSRIVNATDTRAMLSQGGGLVAEFRNYRTQSAAETSQLAAQLAALRSEMSAIKTLLIRTAAA